MVSALLWSPRHMSDLCTTLPNQVLVSSWKNRSDAQRLG